MSSHVALMKQLAAHEVTTAHVAEVIGCSEARALELLQVYTLTRDTIAAERQEHARQFRRRLAKVAVVASVALLAVPLWASNAWAGTCASTLPVGLVTFCPDEPALSSEVNGNFQQLVTWLQEKVGTVGNGNITTSAINAATVNATGGISGSALSSTSSVVCNGDLRSLGNIWENKSRSTATVANGVDCSNGACVGVTPFSMVGYPSSTNFATCPQGTFMCGVGASYIAGNPNFWQSLQIIPECCAL